MSLTRHHNEWLSLVPNSGPFLSLPVLAQAFAQGLDAHDAEHARRLRMAFDEWDDNQLSNRPDPGIHRAWIKFVLGETLGYDELLADKDDAILMETNRSWSIDDKRYHFQFSTEIGWEIKGGKKGRMIKNPSYSGISTEFWNACAAIAGREHWTLWGVPNCGKGQPEQVMGTGHGASPARFHNIKIGSAYAG